MLLLETEKAWANFKKPNKSMVRKHTNEVQQELESVEQEAKIV